LSEQESASANRWADARILLFPPFLIDLVFGATILFVVVYISISGKGSLPWLLTGGAWAVSAILLPLAVLRTTNRFVLLAAAFWWVPLLGLLIVNGVQHLGAS